MIMFFTGMVCGWVIVGAIVVLSAAGDVSDHLNQ
jgi:hypothetical protein